MFKKAAILAGVFACLSLPAFAAECEFPYEKVFAEFASAGAPLSVIPTEKLGTLVDLLEKDTGKELGDVTRGFLVMLPPINLGPATPLVDQLSGQDKSGRIGA